MQNDEILNENAGQDVDTATTGDEQVVNEQENPETKNDEATKTFTQEQVNDFIRDRLERDRQSFFNRYGVKDRTGLDDLVGKAQSYDVMNERYETMKGENSQLKEEMAFIKNNINPERYEDVKAYFKGKDLPFDTESLANELETHPEWLNVVKVDDKPKTTVKIVGTDGDHIPPKKDEKAEAMKLFGLK